MTPHAILLASFFGSKHVLIEVDQPVATFTFCLLRLSPKGIIVILRVSERKVYLDLSVGVIGKEQVSSGPKRERK